ncbi:MAG: aspartate-semialdehyde dehydrogenase [Solirubrobacteraceae bacterium]|jgi:aspartate-semialdehyde dehydrogenase|nr:aspartate-semialdehyde dehydrogenase [Solirubrobacteraceae bacterium]
MSAYRVAVVGATGAVGTIMLEVLEERRFPAAEIVPFASERSAGRDLGGRTVRALSEESIQGFDVAIFSAGATVSGEWSPRFARAGAVVVDNSSRWRTDATVPLVVAEVNPEALDGHRGIVANPNCSTMQMLVALGPIHRAVGIERLVVSTYQSVSGTGVQAVEELTAQTHAVLHGAEPPAPTVYPHRIAFNVLGGAGTFADGDDHTNEERKMMFETRKILGDEAIRISVTCARVPVVNSHSESVNLETRDELSPEGCRDLLARSPGIAVVDDPRRNVYPTALAAAGRDEVFVGRIRRDEGNPRTLNMWIVSDNLRKGAATNTVQLAELLHERGLIGPRAARAA